MVEDAGKYLGLLTKWGLSKKEALRFIKDKVVCKLNRWKNLFLNEPDRETLIKAVVTGIPTCAMTFFKLPKTWCREVAALTAQFWWGTKGNEWMMHSRRWHRMEKPKEVGDGIPGYPNLQ